MEPTKTTTPTALELLDDKPRPMPQRVYDMLSDATDSEGFYAMAKYIAKSEFCPRAHKGKPENVALAIQFGRSVGLEPMQAVQGIAVINGTPAVWGQALMGIIQSSAVCEYIYTEWDEEKQRGVCTAKRFGYPKAVTYTFSMKQADKAKLLGKDTWKGYPEVMCQWRALGLMSRLHFADVTKGLVPREEAIDYDVVINSHSADELNRRVEAVRQARAHKVIEDADGEVIDDAVAEDVDDEQDDDDGNSGKPEPPKATAEDLIHRFEEYGVQSPTYQDMVTNYVLGEEGRSVKDLNEEEIIRVGKAFTYIGKMAAEKTMLFLTHVGTNPTWLTNKKQIREAFDAFLASETE